MAIVRSITKKGNSIRAVNDFGKVFIQKIEQRLRKEYTIFCVAFDPYTPDQLPKIRNKGNETSSCINYQINDTTNIEKINFTEFLRSNITKRNLTLYLAKMLHSYFSETFQYCFSIAQNQLRKDVASILDFSHAEADTLLI